jgi:hypothetical protein
MHFKDIYVGGIKTIVINRKATWIKMTSGKWVRPIPETPDSPTPFRTHENMMNIVNHLKGDRRYEFGIDAECGTLHINRKKAKNEQMISVRVIVCTPKGVTPT